MRRILLIPVIILLFSITVFPETTVNFSHYDNYLLEGRYSEAVTDYRQFAVENYNHRLAPAALFNAASIAQLELNDIEAAKNDFLRLTEEFPKSKWTAEAYRRLGEIARNENDFNSALKYYQMGIQSAEGEDYAMPEFWTAGLAQQCRDCLGETGDKALTVKILQELTQYMPSGDAVRECKYQLAAALKELDRKDETAQAFKELLYYYPQSETAQRIIADEKDWMTEYVDFPWETLNEIRNIDGLFRSGEYSQVKSILQEISAQYPATGFEENSEYSIILCGVYESGDFQTAFDQLRDYDDKYPNGVRRSEVQRNIDTWAEILQLMDNIEADPDDCASHQQIGFILLRNRMLQFAEEHFLEAVKDPEFYDSHMGLGYTYLYMQQPEKCIEHLEIYLKEYPNDGNAYNRVGYAYLQVNRNEKALNCFKRYMELEPDNPNSHDSYAECLMNMGEYEEAIAEYHKALELNPNWSNAVFMLGEIYRQQGDNEKALDQYRRYLEMDPSGRLSQQAQANIESINNN
ncbi:tetratricopeptide repeat protein [bacterium]|nr:tetratricopeptide repeat protein [bacterium]